MKLWMVLLRLTPANFQVLFSVSFFSAFSLCFHSTNYCFLVGIYIPSFPSHTGKTKRLLSFQRSFLLSTECNAASWIYFFVSNLCFRSLKTDALTCGFPLVHALPWLNSKSQFYRQVKTLTVRYNIPQTIIRASTIVKDFPV